MAMMMNPFAMSFEPSSTANTLPASQEKSSMNAFAMNFVPRGTDAAVSIDSQEPSNLNPFAMSFAPQEEEATTTSTALFNPFAVSFEPGRTGPTAAALGLRKISSLSGSASPVSTMFEEDGGCSLASDAYSSSGASSDSESQPESPQQEDAKPRKMKALDIDAFVAAGGDSRDFTREQRKHRQSTKRYDEEKITVAKKKPEAGERKGREILNLLKDFDEAVLPQDPNNARFVEELERQSDMQIRELQRKKLELLHSREASQEAIRGSGPVCWNALTQQVEQSNANLLHELRLWMTRPALESL